ncbi:MAG: hypothetical protein K2P41_12690 [Lachnospiraceae bacterium]|nr:hypothetical protein [Lachnospiraceae bacterium]
MEKRPSETIGDVLKFLEDAGGEYRAAYAGVGAEDNKLQTFLHDMEFAPSQKERNKIATKLQQSRRARRKAKDRVKLYENIHILYTDKQYANLIKALRRLQNEQAAVEKYLFGSREFKKRVDY